jgi:DNA-binding beta-propeller fold protein YncE
MNGKMWFVVLMIACAIAWIPQVQAQSIPKYEVDPIWPKIPDKWVIGPLGGACIDSQDHVFVLHRVENVGELKSRDRQDGIAAPPVMEFDPQGNLVNSWGDNKALGQYLHDCTFDKEGNIWMVGAQSGFAQKWTRDGKTLLLQVGKSGVFDSSDGTRSGKPLNSNTAQFNGPAGIAVDPQNGDVYIADGHGNGNNRIAVIDKTGKFLRQWKLHRTAEEAKTAEDVLHCLRLGNDGLIYVCDRHENRIQVFDKMGNYKRAINIPWKAATPQNEDLRKYCQSTWRTFPACTLIQKIGQGTSAVSVGFSHDPTQRLMYVMNQNQREVDIFDRESGKLLGALGRGEGLFFQGMLFDGIQAAVDSKGNVYVAEDEGRRITKFKAAGQ